MKNTLKIIYITLLCLGVFALGQYLATNSIFNIFEDRTISKNLADAATDKILIDEPSIDLISDQTYLYEVYTGSNNANNETNTLTLYANNKYILNIKTNDQESVRIGWFEQDENIVILHEKYYTNDDSRMFESKNNTIIIGYYTMEGSLNIKSLIDKRDIKMFKVSDDEMVMKAPTTDYSSYTLIQEEN